MPNRNAAPARVSEKHPYKNCPVPDKMFETGII
jgi:hypothetical protein